VAPEHPGYGESTGFDAIEDVVDVVLLYRRLVESLGIDRVDVVGHCLGGMFAAEFAALCPHLVRRLVLVGAYGLWRDDVPVPDPFAIEPADFQKAKWGSNAPLDPEPSIAIPEADNPHAALFDRARNLASATKFLWPIPDRGLWRRLPFVHAPTLVVHGADDGLVPAAYAEEFARLIPGAKVRLIAGSGHYPMFDHEDEFVGAVESFLA
jgi:pimeloyl-ACP methyl ester carboxylesterase